MILTLPVVNVQASSPNVTRFSGFGTFWPPPYLGVQQQIGKCNLTIGTQIYFNFTSTDDRMTGDNHNTFNGLDKPNGKNTVWGTFEFTNDDGEVIIGHVSGQANYITGKLTAHYVGNGPGYKVIWQYVGGFGAGEISGVIIET
jgi:hypothetical protein